MTSRRRTQTRLEKSFLDISQRCLDKAKKLNIKQKSLVRMAENAIYYGICEDDSTNPDQIDKFFFKLHKAFQNDLIFYLNSDYVFSFNNGILLDIFALHPSARGEAQKIFKSNKTNWEETDEDTRDFQRDFQIKQFNISSGLEQPFSREDFRLSDMQPHFTEGRAGEWHFQGEHWGDPNDI